LDQLDLAKQVCGFKWFQPSFYPEASPLLLPAASGLDPLQSLQANAIPMLHGVARCPDDPDDPDDPFPNPKKTVRQMHADKFQFSVFRKVVATWRFCWPWQH